MPRIWKIVITGGPCAGKTESLKRCKKTFEKQGYKVIFIPETATELSNSGITDREVPIEDFQRLILERSLNKEDTTLKIAEIFSKDRDVIIFYDRGIMDGKAYIEHDIFLKLLKEQNISINDVLDRYDAVIHLVTAAIGAEEAYNLKNKARLETLQEAKVKDRATLNSWTGHKNLKIIDNSESFRKKMQKLLKEISLVINNE